MGQTGQNLIGQRVKTARASSNPPITQQKLSDRLAQLGVQIDRAGIAKIEVGIRGVLDYEVAAIAKALNVKVSWLLGVKE